MIEEKYIELEAVGMTQGTTLQEAFILMLKERGGSRFMPVLLDKRGFNLLTKAMAEHKFPRTRLMSRLASAYDLSMEYVRLCAPRDGRIPAQISFSAAGDRRLLEVEVAEGIAAALENGCPIITYRTLFERQFGNANREGLVAVPISVMSKQLLEEALKSAVKEEKFELASLLRDELKQRNSHTD